MKKADLIKQMVADLESRTIWPTDGSLPGASVFKTTSMDLYAVKSGEGTFRIGVWHKSCGGSISYSLYGSNGHKFMCNGYKGEDWCDFELHENDAFRSEPIEGVLYTELIENVDDLAQWPVRLQDETGFRGMIFTTVKPISKEEVLTRRIERLLQIRGVK